MSDSTPITTEQAPELHLDIESADGILTPKVAGDILDAFAEPPRPTTPDVYELREVFVADQEEAAQLEEDLAKVEPVTNEVSEKTIKPRFGSRRPERKPRIDLLNTETRLGRFVASVIFGEVSPKSSKFKPSTVLGRRNRVSEMAGGPVTAKTLQKYRDDN